MSYAGKVLIAHPNIESGNIFKSTVIYIYQDDDKLGTLGVILNKKSRYTIADVCADKNIIFGDTTKYVYHGGPVNQQALVLLHSDEWKSSNTADAYNNLCVTSDNLMLEKIARGDEPAYWRLFGGMSGWQPGQLEAELSGEWPYRPENSWLVATISDEDLFLLDGKEQWQTAFNQCSKQLYDQYFSI